MIHVAHLRLAPDVVIAPDQTVQLNLSSVVWLAVMKRMRTAMRLLTSLPQEHVSCGKGGLTPPGLMARLGTPVPGPMG